MNRIMNLMICLLGSALLLSACNNKTIEEDDAAQFHGYTAERIFENGEHNLNSGDYNRAAKAFEALDVLFPFGHYSRQADLDIIAAYYMEGESASAIASADRFIHLYPRDKAVDYAYYIRGLALMNQYRGVVTRLLHLDLAKRDLSSAIDAYRDFSMLVSLFPSSRYAPDARQHLLYLRNELALHTLQVAQFYYQRRAYIAAVNRASQVVAEFPGTAATETALEIMINANCELKLDQAANDAYQVLKLNYPTSVFQVPTTCLNVVMPTVSKKGKIH